MSGRRANKHHAHTFRTWEQFFKHMCTLTDMGTGFQWQEKPSAKKLRRLQKAWKAHIEKHGNVPMVRKCGVCSGAEHKEDVKHGRFKPGRKTKTERDEVNPKKMKE